MKSSIAQLYTLEKLKQVNEALKQPIVQEFIQANIKNIPLMTEMGMKAVQPLQQEIMMTVQKI